MLLILSQVNSCWMCELHNALFTELQLVYHVWYDYFNFSFTDDLFADLGSTTKKSKPKKTITLDDDDLFGDPLGGLK